jgi:hypothetical protein
MGAQFPLIATVITPPLEEHPGRDETLDLLPTTPLPRIENALPCPTLKPQNMYFGIALMRCGSKRLPTAILAAPPSILPAFQPANPLLSAALSLRGMIF